MVSAHQNESDEIAAIANIRQASSSPSPGTSPPRTSAPPTNRLSPVIVAENMIGVAMYELVCGSTTRSGGTR
jgi:hypothetical protein